MNTREAVQKVNADIDAKINEYGWAVQGVFGDAGGNGFMYTIGLTDHKLPEIVVSGFIQVLQQSINKLAEQMKQNNGAIYGEFDGDMRLANGETLRMAVRPVTDQDNVRENVACGASNRYPDTTFVQLLWADANNILPGEPGYDALKCPQILY